MGKMIVLAIFMLAPLFGCESMQEGYRESYCNYDGAYKKGMNDAREGQPMAGQVAAACYPEQKAVTEKGYREGYTAYLKTAPRKVEINLTNNTGPTTSECKFMSDCSSGKSCRNRGDGIALCLGNEPRGGYCEFSTDCDSSLFCKKVENNIGKCL